MTKPGLGLLAVSVFMALAGCAPATRVTLLPDAGLRSTAVVVTPQINNKAREPVVLDKPLVDVDIYSTGLVYTTPDSQALKRNASLIAIQPAEPLRSIVNFLPGTTELTPESAATLAQAIDNAKKRAGGEIIVVGHTDTVGEPAGNDALSVKRAQAVRDLLIERGFNRDLIEAVGRGQRELLVPTGLGVDEPRNRRVEVIVR